MRKEKLVSWKANNSKNKMKATTRLASLLRSSDDDSSIDTSRASISSSERGGVGVGNTRESLLSNNDSAMSNKLGRKQISEVMNTPSTIGDAEKNSKRGGGGGNGKQSIVDLISEDEDEEEEEDDDNDELIGRPQPQLKTRISSSGSANENDDDESEEDDSQEDESEEEEKEEEEDDPKTIGREDVNTFVDGSVVLESDEDEEEEEQEQKEVVVNKKAPIIMAISSDDDELVDLGKPYKPRINRIQESTTSSSSNKSSSLSSLSSKKSSSSSLASTDSPASPVGRAKAKPKAILSSDDEDEVYATPVQNTPARRNTRLSMSRQTDVKLPEKVVVDLEQSFRKKMHLKNEVNL